MAVGHPDRLVHLQWNETFNLNGVNAAFPAFENINVRSNNYLFGGQLVSSSNAIGTNGTSSSWARPRSWAIWSK